MDESRRAIHIQNLSKVFPLNEKKNTAFSSLKRQILPGFTPPHVSLFALKDIHLEVFQSEKVGIVGENGAGKTTLLKIIAGLSKPTQGQVLVDGEMIFLAGLGIGMIEDLSVRENIVLYGMIYGLERFAIREKIQEILEWAELQEFAESRLINLSSGMKSRLAFSITRHFDKDIFLLDEALSAGDKNFREKAKAIFLEYKKTKRTFVVATHDMEFIKTFCTKAVWIHKGQIQANGNPEDVVEQYQKHRSKQSVLNGSG